MGGGTHAIDQGPALDGETFFVTALCRFNWNWPEAGLSQKQKQFCSHKQNQIANISYANTRNKEQHKSSAYSKFSSECQRAGQTAAAAAEEAEEKGDDEYDDFFSGWNAFECIMWSSQGHIIGFDLIMLLSASKFCDKA